ncbi:MAG: hypothetical protein ABFS46_20460 [Myxococcota bacterium]
MVVLAAVVAQLLSSIGQACAATGVPSWTLRRWGAWWRGPFADSPTWAELRARFVPPAPADTDLPRSLVVRVGDELCRHGPVAVGEVCLQVARLMAPATTSSVPQGSRFVREIGLPGALG